MPISFEGWIQAVFDHPVADPEWYWEPSFEEYWDSLKITPGLTVAYLTRLYRDPSVIKPYSLEQVGQAIWFLVGEASPGQPSHALLDQEVPLEARLECIRAIQGFFAEFVASATPGPGNQDIDAFSDCVLHVVGHLPHVG